MAMRIVAFALLALAGLGWLAPVRAQQTPPLARIVTENVTAELVSARAAVAPGERFHVALRLRVREGWHTYWRNPGDSGAPTTLAWTLPQSWAASEIIWPAPFKAPFPPLMNYGFEGETLYPVEITAPAGAGFGPVALTARADWLVCKEICIPEGGVLALELPVGPAGRDDPQWAQAVAEALQATPRPAPGVEARVSPTPNGARLTVAGEPLENLAIVDAAFFPYSGTLIDHAALQSPSTGPRGVALDLAPGIDGVLGEQSVSGVLVWETQTGRRAIEIEAQPGAPLAGAGGAALATAGLKGAATQSGGVGLTLPWAILFAVLGGLILNVMPCVLPVLSLKALALARGAHDGQARRHGLVFFAGAMTTFLALGGLLVALTQAGAAAGWGFQLQSPWVVGGLGLLFFAIGLNLLGAFEFGAGFQNLGAGLAGRDGDVGAFFTGALAVAAATPCTAPFMAGALGFAATQPAPVALAVFAALGLGFAAPTVALAFSPALLQRIPKPGPWMERLKQFFAFPMFATAVWLAWVLAGQAGQGGLLALLSAATALALVVWAVRELRGAPRYAAIATAAAGLACVGFLSQPAAAALKPEPWSQARVAELVAEGRPVFVNFTADWCVTCKVNERVALSSDAVARAFADADVAYLKGDWTARDDVIAAELARHGRDGVPLYLFFQGDPDRPVVLPQLLTPDMVVKALAPEPTAPREVAGDRPGGA